MQPAGLRGKEIGGIAGEARGATVTGVRVDGRGIAAQIVATGEDGLDGAVVRRAMGQRPRAGGLEPCGRVLLGQTQHALGGPQLLEDAVGQQPGDELLAACPDAPGLLETPVAVVSEEASRVGGQMVGTEMRSPRRRPRRCVATCR